MRQAQEYLDIPLSRRLLDQGATLVATGCFSGYAGIVPGTVGSLVGLLLYLPLAAIPIPIRIGATVALFFLGVYASSHVATVWQIKDPKPVVIDEIVGMWIALLLVPNGAASFVGAFLLFRLFDVVKPFPARQAELLNGGWGIMLDDVFAGVYAGVTIQGFDALRAFFA